MWAEPQRLPKTGAQRLPLPSTGCQGTTDRQLCAQRNNVTARSHTGPRWRTASYFHPRER